MQALNEENLRIKKAGSFQVYLWMLGRANAGNFIAIKGYFNTREKMTLLFWYVVYLGVMYFLGKMLVVADFQTSLLCAANGE